MLKSGEESDYSPYLVCPCCGKRALSIIGVDTFTCSYCVMTKSKRLDDE